MSSITKEVRVRGYGQDRDIKVTIEKTGLLNNKRNVYTTFWGSNQKPFERNKSVYEWDPIEFTKKDLTEDNNFGEYQKYYEAYIKERDQPKGIFKAYDSFMRNNLKFSSEWNTDLDIIKLYILINTEKLREITDAPYEWSLIEDPIKGEKGGLAPYYRGFGYDSYYLNNGTRVDIRWTEENGKYSTGGESWSNSKGGELDEQDLTRYNTSYLEKKEKRRLDKYIDLIRPPENNPGGDKKIYFSDEIYIKNHFERESVLTQGEQKRYDFVSDIYILGRIIYHWKEAVPGYDSLDILKNEHGTPAIEISDSKQALIEYKSPFAPATQSAATQSAATQSAAPIPTPKIKLNIVGLSDDIKVVAKHDIPEFKIHIGDIPIEEDPIKSVDYDVFDDTEGLDDDDEYKEADFVEENLNAVTDEPIGDIYDYDPISISTTTTSESTEQGGSSTEKSAIGVGPNPGSKILQKIGKLYFLFNAGNGLAGHRLKSVLKDLENYLNSNGYPGTKIGNNGIMRDLRASTYPDNPARAVASLHGAGLAIDVTFNIPGKKWKGIGDNENLASDSNLNKVIAKWVAGQGDLTWGAQWGGSNPSTGVVKGWGIVEYHHFEIKASLIANYWKPFESELSQMGFKIAKLNTTGKGGEIFRLNKVLLNSVGIA